MAAAPRNIAVLSSGTDLTGINGTIRAVVHSALARKWTCYGVQWGFRGLIANDILRLTSRSVSGCFGKASCFLGTGRCEGVLTDEALALVAETLCGRKITGVVVVGGGGSLAASRLLTQFGVQVVGIPATLQDDITGTETCLGVDSALNNIVKAVDHIRSCDSSRNRTFLVQVEGRQSGSLATKAAIVTGCEFLLVPEDSVLDPTRAQEKLLAIADAMLEASKEKTLCLALVAEGWKPGFEALEKVLEERERETDLMVRKTILGYIQRGGSPTAADRLLGTKMGAMAVQMIAEDVSEQFTAVQDGKIVAAPYSLFLNRQKPLSEEYQDLFKMTS
jgi:6-phosphofructokinase 1